MFNALVITACVISTTASVATLFVVYKGAKQAEAELEAVRARANQTIARLKTAIADVEI